MLTEKEWKQKEKEIAELQELKKAIAEKIHLLKCSLRQHEKPKSKKMNTIVNKMFGKKIKDLTTEEFKIYYNARQKKNRADRKKGIFKRGATKNV